ncbi:MAG: M28 family peptidase [Thermoanaerobaculia bacterium]|jgi:hypothetical protein
MNMKIASALSVILTLAAATGFAQPQKTELVAPKHAMTIKLDPATHRITVKDRIELPASMMGAEFVLADTLAITSSSPSVERVPPGDLNALLGTGSGESGERLGLARYKVGAVGSDRTITLEYGGVVNTTLSDEKEQYSRGFRSTPGLIGPEGIYLSATSGWYPLFDGGLVSFDLDVTDVPEGWHVITIGGGTSRDAQGHARWVSEGLVDDIYLVGGPLNMWKDSAGVAEALVYLHDKDDALAAKYLTATAQYIEMYRSLIGPYPYGKFALVENFWETGYGMPSFTLLGSQVIRFPFIIVSSYPHEILHNWWGNSVFVDYETGNWCEGLTAYMADHLLKEQRGQGAEYRQSTLQKYRDYVSEGRDFPLTEFRSRHSAATEAVGYGKSLMGFHMLRRQVGDDAFRKALATFYKKYRGKRASFADVRRTFEEVTKSDLGPVFHDWVERAGAPALVVKVDGVKQVADGWSVTGTLRQTQPEASGTFAWDVPVAMTTADGLETSSVTLAGRETKFALKSTSRPLLLEVDPAFDVFRLLDPRETPPSIGQIFGEPKIVAVVPSKASAEEQKRWRELMAGWQSESHSISIVDDSSLKALPADTSLWLLGRENLFAAKTMSSDAALGLGVAAEAVKLAGEEAVWKNHSIVVVRRHPGSASHAIGWLAVDPAEAFAGLGRKLPHYGKYSYLAFEGAEPTNTIKGQWAGVDSPLRVDLRPAKERPAPVAAKPAPARKALAELPPVFSEKKLLENVTWLAAPEREGRGAGSKGLADSAQWIADKFKAAGLQPGGDGGGWFQKVTLPAGPDGKPVELMNVIGVLPGTNPDWKGQWNLVSAHYDHLGYGWPDGAKGQLHPGADDNASGVSVLVELAGNLATTEKPKRTLVFAAFTAEERGLVGSRHFASSPTPFALVGLRAAINLDTVGRLGGQKLTVFGAGTADEWPHVFRGIGWVTGIECQTVSGNTEGSDQQAFIEKGIPAVQIFTQGNLDYHKPGDVAAKIDAAGLVKVATVVREALVYLNERPEPLTIRIVGQPNNAPPPAAPPAGGRKVRFGTIPDMTWEGEGMKLDGVVPDSPAAKAGLAKGDVIVGMNGEPVKSLREYAGILGKLEPGQKVEVVYARDGKETKVVVAVEAR